MRSLNEGFPYLTFHSILRAMHNAAHLGCFRQCARIRACQIAEGRRRYSRVRYVVSDAMFCTGSFDFQNGRYFSLNSAHSGHSSSAAMSNSSLMAGIRSSRIHIVPSLFNILVARA
jgi:hypothetical protein